MEYAAPSCTDSIAATARDQAGTRLLTAEACQQADVPRATSLAGAAASTWPKRRSGRALSDSWARYSRGGDAAWRPRTGQAVKLGSQRSSSPRMGTVASIWERTPMPPSHTRWMSMYCGGRLILKPAAKSGLRGSDKRVK